MTQIEQQLNSKLEEIPEEIRTNRESNWINDEEDAERMPSTSNSEINISEENTHQTMKSIESKIRKIAFSPQKCMN